MDSDAQTNALQAAKAVTRAYSLALDTNISAQTIKSHVSSDYTWRGMHPFHQQPSAEDAYRVFWQPLSKSLTGLHRRENIFFAGYNECDEGASIWTCSVGHMMGLFDVDWLGMPATRKIAQLPYAEFHRIEAGKIAETAFFCDILRIANQSGLTLLPPQTGADISNPAPRTQDGLLLDPQDPAEGDKTLRTVNSMAADIAQANAVMQGSSDAAPIPPRDELARHWHEDMCWYGPTGIGATYTIDRYITQHQRPFRTHLANRIFNGHVARIAEGKYCAFFGWPNLTLTATGGFMGLPASQNAADMRVADIYRRDGEKLAENWVIIDMLHFLNMQGLDVLSRLDV